MSSFTTQSPFAQVAMADSTMDCMLGFDVSSNSTNTNTTQAGDHFTAHPSHRLPFQRAMTSSMPLRAGSYYLAGNLVPCRSAKAPGRISCGTVCCGTTEPCSAGGAQQQQPALAQHMSLPAYDDFDALLAAAARKPGYTASTEVLDTGSTQEAFAQQQQEEPSMEEMTCMDAPMAPAPAVCAVLEQYGARDVLDGAAGGIADAALGLIAENTLADTFYIYDLGEVSRLYSTWVSTMPRVMPFYAVKCNPEPSMVAMLAALGAGFDCASIQELQLAAAHGVSQDRIIFANPCKRPADFRYAAEHSVAVTTFDCVSELEKIAVGYPFFKCVLRIRCDDASAKINLGLKYGADLCDVPMLLGMARDLDLEVVGVSFHVGSGCQNVGVYADAIAAARQAFDVGATYGFDMNLLDIGGGFTAPYDEPSARLFYTTAAVINAALDHHFPEGCGIRIIAEPGRYFAETSATLFTTILGQREGLDALGGPFRDYWLSDGTYGSFRIQVAVDGLEPTYSVLRSPLLPDLCDESAAGGPPLVPCRLWGNSDRDGDVVHKAAMLPVLRDGDWLMFPFAGAYTICAASNYGGVRFTQPLKLFIYSSSAERDTCGFDLPAGIVAAKAAVHAHFVSADDNCCGSDADSSCAVAAAGGVFVDTSDNSSSNSGHSPHAAGGSSSAGSGSLDVDCMVAVAHDDEACLLCDAAGVDGAKLSSVPCGCVVAAVDDGCMSVASEGTAAGGVVLEDSHAEAEVCSMVFA